MSTHLANCIAYMASFSARLICQRAQYVITALHRVFNTVGLSVSFTI